MFANLLRAIKESIDEAEKTEGKKNPRLGIFGKDKKFIDDIRRDALRSDNKVLDFVNEILSLTNNSLDDSKYKDIKSEDLEIFKSAAKTIRVLHNSQAFMLDGCKESGIKRVKTKGLEGYDECKNYRYKITADDMCLKKDTNMSLRSCIGRQGKENEGEELFDEKAQEPRDDRYDYMDFSKCAFSENLNDEKKIFNDSNLFKVNFRYCDFNNIDFSKTPLEDFNSINFWNCKFDGKCIFPEGVSKDMIDAISEPNSRNNIFKSAVQLGKNGEEYSPSVPDKSTSIEKSKSNRSFGTRPSGPGIFMGA